MPKFNSARTPDADIIIKKHTLWSMGAGLIPIIVADVLAVTAVQLDMIKQLCRLYDIDFNEQSGKALITTLGGSVLTRIASAGAGSVIKLIPGIGSLLGGVTVAAFAGASTYATGEVCKMHFESGGQIWNLKAEDFKEYYEEQFKKGKKLAQQWKEEAKETVESNTDTTTNSSSVPTEKNAATQLKELDDLRKAGIISQSEFNTMKEKIFQDFLKKNQA